jgi:hypothetical protein
MANHSEYAALRSHENRLGLLRNGGGEHSYDLKLTGRELYHLLSLLEGVALDSSVYLQVRDSVKLAELLREQARAQGFDKAID